MNQIELKGVFYSNEKKPIINNIDLLVDEGEIVLIAGPNASGKTTLAKLCAGLLVPTMGDILVNGISVSKYQHGVEYVASNSGLISNRTVVENIVLKLRYHPELQKYYEKERIDKICSGFGINPFVKNLPSQISSGVRRRVAIARALIARPQFLIVDGLLHDIDALEGLKLLDLIKSLCEEENISVLLFSTHIDPESRVADRIAILKDGKFSVVGKPDEVISDPWVNEILELKKKFSL
ncbi:MAG: ABC transporter ATP-binding protein [Planctomycetes bacterium]|nr:ABC transporter ATP-binding protein [Planctomycetota bacterium]